MNMLKKKMVMDKSTLSLELPLEFLNKEIEVIVKIIDTELEDKLLLSKVNIDTKKWKFNREKIYNE